MQTLNILAASKYRTQTIDELRNSKYSGKIYITADSDVLGAKAVNFNTFRELAQKCKALQIDLVIVEEEQWIQQGIGNVMKQHFVNCLAPTTEITDLGISHVYARELLEKYEISVPEKITLPVDFPVILKANGIIKKAESINDVISLKEKIFNTSPEVAKTVFLEKYIEGEKYNVCSVFDGKHLLTFPHKGIPQFLLDEYSAKLENLLLKEEAKGIFSLNSELIPYKGVLYNTGFSFKFLKPDCNVDFLYVALSAIYQKLNEIRFEN